MDTAETHASRRYTPCMRADAEPCSGVDGRAMTLLTDSTAHMVVGAWGCSLRDSWCGSEGGGANGPGKHRV